MGCAPSTNKFGLGGTKEEKRRNASIEEELRRAKGEMKLEVKMLLLGAGESGKSTMVKQLRLMYKAPFTEEEREQYRPIVFANTLQSIQAVLRAYPTLETHAPLPASLHPSARLLLSIDQVSVEQSQILDPDLVLALERLWDDIGVKKAVLEDAGRFQLNDSAAYFFENLDRIKANDYLPSDQDILRTRVRSTGITEEKFKLESHVLRVFDVGGQRSERKKWIHCFENVQVLVFVAALSEYDQQLWEDESMNRLSEAITLFTSILHSRWFTQTSFILLLNKTDLFRHKLEVDPEGLKRACPAYEGEPGNYDDGCRFLRAKFLRCARGRTVGPGKATEEVYCFFTCATDTQQVRKVISAVMNTLFQQVLTGVGLL